METKGRTDSGRTRRRGEPHPLGVGVAVMAVWHRRDWDGRLWRTRWESMQDYCRLINRTTILRAVPVPVTASRPATVADRITALDPRIRAVFLIGLGPTDAAVVQSITVAPRLVVSDADARTATLAAFTLSNLYHRGISVDDARLLIYGTEHTPHLRRVLLDCGANTVTALYGKHVDGPRTRRLLMEHDLIVRLDEPDNASGTAANTVSLPTDSFHHVTLALPGLLSALSGHASIRVTSDVLAATARAIALIAPVDGLLPEHYDPQLTPTIASYIGTTIGGGSTDGPL